MKKSFTLMITILFISIFSYISISILQTKSISSKNLQNQYLYIQGKNHMSFFKEYLKSLDLTHIDTFEIFDTNFLIYAYILKKDNFYDVDMFVKAKNSDISLYEKLIK